MVRAYSLGTGGRHLARLEPLKARTREERARLGERLNGDAWHAQANLRVLLERRLITDPMDGLKILGNGELTKKLTVKASAFSASAKEKIEAAGGKAEVV